MLPDESRRTYCSPSFTMVPVKVLVFEESELGAVWSGGVCEGGACGSWITGIGMALWLVRPQACALASKRAHEERPRRAWNFMDFMSFNLRGLTILLLLLSK